MYSLTSSTCGACSLVQVSHKVHSQLLQIADERALAAEQKARQLEREVGMALGREGGRREREGERADTEWERGCREGKCIARELQ